jgi:hypothetical protein
MLLVSMRTKLGCSADVIARGEVVHCLSVYPASPSQLLQIFSIADKYCGENNYYFLFPYLTDKLLDQFQ